MFLVWGRLGKGFDENLEVGMLGLLIINMFCFGCVVIFCFCLWVRFKIWIVGVVVIVCFLMRYFFFLFCSVGNGMKNNFLWGIKIICLLGFWGKRLVMGLIKILCSFCNGRLVFMVGLIFLILLKDRGFNKFIRWIFFFFVLIFFIVYEVLL